MKLRRGWKRGPDGLPVRVAPRAGATPKDGKKPRRGWKARNSKDAESVPPSGVEDAPDTPIDFTPKHPARSGHVSTQRLQRALRTAAKLVALGDEFIPVFERIERELAERQKTNDAKSRAKALLRKPAEEDD